MKVPRLSSFWIVALVTWLLFLAGTTLTQAQAQTKARPPAPAPATWTVRIPTQAMLNGDGSGDYTDYIHGSNNVEVTVQKNSVRPSMGSRSVTTIAFRISTPTSRRVYFSDVFLWYLNPADYAFVDPDIGCPCCVLPVLSSCDGSLSNECSSCTCIQDFLNGASHPYTADENSTYRFLLIEIDAFDMDLDQLQLGTPYRLGQAGHLNDYVVVSMVYQTASRAPTYHNIDLQKSAHLGADSLHPFNIWITRLTDGTNPEGTTWRVEVGRACSECPTDPKADPRQFLFAEEYYREQTNGKQPTVWHSTLFQGGYFYFTFDLMRKIGS